MCKIPKKEHVHVMLRQGTRKDIKILAARLGVSVSSLVQATLDKMINDISLTLTLKGEKKNGKED